MDAGSATYDAEVTSARWRLTRVESDFVGQIAVAVWLCRLTDEAAREVLVSYAMARHRGKRVHAGLCAALEREYRHCRERQDLCS
jgi:hypothetical protein